MVRLLAVALLSAATLAYEILLVRVFAIEHFHHFAYMAIGVAMLGFGASGTLLATIGSIEPTRAQTYFAWSSVLTAVALLASPALAHQVPLDPTQLAWDYTEWLRWALVCALLAMPFAAGAMSVLLALVLEPARPGWTYGASFLGSGLGAALAVALSWLVFPERVLAAPAVVAALGSWAASRSASGAARSSAGSALALLAGGGVFLWPLWRLEVSPYKALPQVEAYPSARRLAESASPLGWTVAVDAPAFRYAPGLSLGFAGTFPRQIALFVDGDIAGAAMASGIDTAGSSMFDWLPTALPYATGALPRVLVVGAGGGTEVQNALDHGAESTTAVELHPEIARLARAQFPEALEEDGSVRWVVGDARSYVARSREKFDLVTVAPAGGFGPSAAGVHSLNEDFLHTVDAYIAYLRLLSDRGMLAVTRWITVPPRASVRTVLTAAEALRRVAPGKLPQALLVARSWGTATVLAKPSGFTPAELEALRVWATARQFDIDWCPGQDAPASRFNELEPPTLFEAASAAMGGADSSAAFASRYPFFVAPVGDARPFPHHFIRLGSLGRFLRGDRGAWLPFAEWGPIALVATLAQSAVLAGLLIVLPAAAGRRRMGQGGRLALLTYFFAIGLGYMAAEIAAIQQVGLLLGHPVYAVAVVLTAFLVFSGIGSASSDRMTLATCRVAAGWLVVLFVLYGVALLTAVHLLQPSPLLVRVAAAFACVAPAAFLMGLPFPMGLRWLASGSQPRLAWAWAANGFASVVAAPLAALVALEAGSPVLFLIAAGAYGVAAGLGGRARADRSGSRAAV